MKKEDLSIILGLNKSDINYLKRNTYFSYLERINENCINQLPHVKIKDNGIPEYDWAAWKEFKEEANKVKAIESNFTEGVNKEEVKRPRGKRNIKFLREKKDLFMSLDLNKIEMAPLERDLSNAWDLLKINTSRQSGAIEKIIEKTHSLLKMSGELKCLPNKGEQSYYIDENGSLIKGTKSRKKNSGSKTLDFFYRLNGKKYFIAHKQRDGDGGGQSEAAHEAAKIAKYSCKDAVMCCIFEGKQNSNYQDSKDLEHEYFKVFDSWTSFYEYIIEENNEH